MLHQLSLFDQVRDIAPDLILDIPPSTNRIWVNINIKGHTARVLTKEAKAYMRMVAGECDRVHMKPIAGDVWLIMNFYNLRANRDLSNNIKLLEDAMIGHAYADDIQVRRILVEAIEEPKVKKVTNVARVEVYVRKLER